MGNYTTQTQIIDPWNLRIYTPPEPGPHPVLLLLHGWTGDENSMWVFANRMPAHFLMIAPRGIYTTPLGGRGWHPKVERMWPTVEDLQPAVNVLLQLLSNDHFPGADFSRLHLMGFSQGAALSYTLALLHPDKVGRIAGLAGFMPEQADDYIQQRVLAGKKIFSAHGTRDELVPIERARQSVTQLERAGAQVSYCEEDVGHKLSVTCFRSLASFFAESNI
jgi:phospholipase/carboxylesterase